MGMEVFYGFMIAFIAFTSFCWCVDIESDREGEDIVI